MRVSVRLQKSLWASALVLSLAVTQSPSMTFGQNQFPVGNTVANSVNGQFSPPGEQSAPVPTDKATMVEARRALLKARQALAHSDVETAKAMMESARQHVVDFKQIGDSPTTIQSMIDRQTQLTELRRRNDPAYNAGAASFLLTQAEALTYYQDFETAQMLITQARDFPVEFNSAIGNPDQLEQMIEVAKNNAAVAQAAQSNVSPAAPSKKAETMKLLSQAQLAMDQGKWNEAKHFVDQAKQIGVPDAEYASNEPRPWQFDLKIQNALNRQAFDPAVIQTNFESQPAANVVQANYDPNSDMTRNVPVSGSDAVESTTKFSPIPKTAMEFYQSGLAALESRNPAEARSYFEKAWENQAELDGATRQSLQDKLTRLTSSDSMALGTVPSTIETESANRVTQASQDVDIDDVQTQQQNMFRKIQSEVFRERAAAERLLETSPRQAIEKMSMVRGRIAQSQLDPNSQRPLLKMIDRDIDVMQRYIDDNLPAIINDEQNSERLENVDLRRQRKVDIGTQIQKLVEEFNNLVDEERFPEALVVARQANDLAPEEPTVVILMEKAKFLERINRMQTIRDGREEGFYNSMADVEESSKPGDFRTPMLINDTELYARRAAERGLRNERIQYSSEEDRQIWNTLRNERVQGEYTGSLAEAMDQLARQAGVNIVFDDMALAAENIRKDSPVDVPIRQPISLRSALDVILQSAGLVFVVENEVIKVTSRDARQTKLKVKHYYIGDLVMPITGPQHPMHMTFMQPQGMNGGAGSMNVGNQPNNQLAMAQQLGGNAPNNPFGGGAAGAALFDGYRGGGTRTGVPTYGTVGGQPLGGITEADFQPLIDLIQGTIQPDSWQDTGQGLGTIQPFVPNLSLIVSQTQEIQDQIQDLLKKLRELNDVQIVVEVRFISLADNYFERIGIDFDFSINDNSQIVDPNADNPFGGSTIIGNSPVDSTPFTPTSDLDIQFLQGSFAAAEPIFGGFQAASAANFGFAILSDIEVFFLIQASKGDQRTNITQAPTVTMFNGQSANVNDGAARPFVTSVIPVVGDFAVAHQPVITILPDGTNLNVTAVVSDDRRFVRLQLVPFFSQVTEVETFTFDGSTTTERTTNSVLDDLLDAVDGGANADSGDEEIVTTTQGITVQLPVLSFTSVNTVVSVPDGGTVLMGGVKRMREGRTEQGVPFLSNVPYVNRLFKNVGIGHETSNLMMMVTPRIIIQKEIEEDQVGLTDTTN